MPKTETITSRNTDHGFFRTIQHNYGIGERDAPAYFDAELGGAK